MADALVQEAAKALREQLGPEPRWAAVAPGRVNLIGEHTDYNAGLVLPCAIDRGTAAVAAGRSDGNIRVYSCSLGSLGEIVPGSLSPGEGWLDYVQGVVAAFASEGLPVPGLDVAIASDLPRESGLSSSASLQVALASLFGEVGGLGLSPSDRARLAHRAETEFVGVPCGQMDQLASALGRADHALRIDCRDHSVRLVAVPGERLRLLITDSGVRRQLTDGGYARRREECESALSESRARGLVPADAATWRDAPADAVVSLMAELPEPLGRRARHVLTESPRVDAMCAALRDEDLARAGALLQEGQASLRDDFEVSCPELDALCEIADAVTGCHGSRLTGAGFGGCTLHLVDADAVDRVTAALTRGFDDRFGRIPPILSVRISAGARSGPIADLA